MAEICLWTLALGTAPLVLAALWDQLDRLNHLSTYLRKETVRS
jgi:hypothetical protein